MGGAGTFLLRAHYERRRRNDKDTQGGPKIGTLLYALSNSNQYANSFTVRIRRKLVITLTKDPTKPQTYCYTCEISVS